MLKNLEALFVILSMLKNGLANYVVFYIWKVR